MCTQGSTCHSPEMLQHASRRLQNGFREEGRSGIFHLWTRVAWPGFQTTKFAGFAGYEAEEDSANNASGWDDESSRARSIPTPRIVEDSEHCIKPEDISRSAWFVISRLKAAGHEAFLVGGTVRDLLLRKEPKDIDIVTSCHLKQVARLFERSLIVGRRFPICKVRQGKSEIEISSLPTGIDADLSFPLDMAQYVKKTTVSKEKYMKWSEARKLNARRRDFTVNALLYDPASHLLFDYVGGLDDLKARRLATIARPSESFREDPARILRAIRFAARVGLTIDERTSFAARQFGESILDIPEARAQLEVHSILGYGSSKQSMKLLWEHGLLNVIFPKLVDFLVQEGHVRDEPLKPCFLLDFLDKMDSCASPSKPVDTSIVAATLSAAMLVHHFRKLKTDLKKSVQSQGSEESKRISKVKEQSEEVIFTNLLRGTLGGLAEASRGYSILAKATVLKAAKLLSNFRQLGLTAGHGVSAPEAKYMKAILSVRLKLWEKEVDLSGFLQRPK